LLIPGTIPLFILGIIIIAPAASRNVRNLLEDRDSVTKWFTAPLEEKVLSPAPPASPSPISEKGPAFRDRFLTIVPLPNHDRYAVPAVKREGLPDWVFPFPSSRGEGAGVRGKATFC
jgi:hypothetical protein